ncbi:MAG: hypothetical protein AAB719_02240 [Patescibacteria group bacterium]
MDIWVSAEHYSQYEGDEEIIYRQPDILLSELDVFEKEYIETYKKSVGKTRTACLMAHGCVGRGSWLYADRGRIGYVQSWIDKRDFEYGLIVLYSCNVMGFTPTSKHALLLVPDSSFSLFKVNLGVSNINLIHPTKGELEHTIEYELSELRKTLGGPI